MTTDTFRGEFAPNTFGEILAIGKLRFGSILTFIGCAGVFVGYIVIFTVSLLTVGFLEIRQANMADFNSLIAVLEERDGYADGHLDNPLKQVEAERNFTYRASVDLVCPESAGTAVITGNQRTAEAGDLKASKTNPKTCAEMKQLLLLHANELAVTEREARFRKANSARANPSTVCEQGLDTTGGEHAYIFSGRDRADGEGCRDRTDRHSSQVR